MATQLSVRVMVLIERRLVGNPGTYKTLCRVREGGGVRPSSPPRHDTTAPEEPTPARVQPPRQAKMKDAEFHYTK